MARREAVRKAQPDAGKATSDVIEQKGVALAEAGRIRDGAVDQLDHVNRASTEARKAGEAKPGMPS